MITHVYSFTNFINEAKKKSSYSKSCAMIYVDFPKEVKDIHDAIDKDDIYTEKGDRTFGLEKEAHCTLLYGIDGDVPASDVKDILKDFDFGTLSVSNVSMFDNDKYDVLKFDVKAKSLNKANKMLKELPYESDFPDYHAHLTIGYLKKGTAEKYIKQFKNIKFEAEPSKIVYSVPSGIKHTIISFKKNKKDK